MFPKLYCSYNNLAIIVANYIFGVVGTDVP